MSKFIIENRTKLSDVDVLMLVTNVVEQGRISNYGKQYCYATKITIENESYMVLTDLNKKSDRFIIIKR